MLGLSIPAASPTKTGWSAFTGPPMFLLSISSSSISVVSASSVSSISISVVSPSNEVKLDVPDMESILSLSLSPPPSFIPNFSATSPALCISLSITKEFIDSVKSLFKAFRLF